MKTSMTGMGAPKKGMVTKPHIRMRKMRPVASSAFPSGPVAFPTDPNASDSSAMGPSAPAMPGGAGGGDMGS